MLFKANLGRAIILMGTLSPATSFSGHAASRRMRISSGVQVQGRSSVEPASIKSNNFPDERYRKNRLLYTQLKEDISLPSTPRQRWLAKPKILSPAGGWPQLEAAISAGADAVYFGCNAGLNARARAANFELSELASVMTHLHERGVEGYMCMNVLVFDNELNGAEVIIREAAKAGVDALIVQDLGLSNLVHRVSPHLPVHASTQMSVTDGAGALFAATRLGCETVVVGRELSIPDIATVVDVLRGHELDNRRSEEEAEDENGSALSGADRPPSMTGDGGDVARDSVAARGGSADSGGGVRIEAFVHGALCVSYSGQCFSSEAWGGRSANRGQCAQACRMPYALIVDGEMTGFTSSSPLSPPPSPSTAEREPEDTVGYLLSPQDLCSLERVTELIAAGVDTFKIEGRLKGPEYVYTTTRAYREKVDEAWARTLEKQESLWGAHTDDNENDKLEESAAITAATVVKAEAEAALFGSGWVPSMDELAQVFARGQDAEFGGLSTGFLDGARHQQVVRGRAPKHRGVLLGEVLKVVKLPPPRNTNGGKGQKQQQQQQQAEEFGVVVRLARPVKRGDGLVFDGGSPHLEELGGSVFGVFPVGRSQESELESADTRPGMEVVLTFSRDVNNKLAKQFDQQGGGSFSTKKKKKKVQSGSSSGGGGGRGGTPWSFLQPGDLVWQTHDAALLKRVAASIKDKSLARSRCPVTVEVDGKVGELLRVRVTEAQGRSETGGVGSGAGGLVGEGFTSSALQPCGATSSAPLSLSGVRQAIGQLGGTPFSVVNAAMPTKSAGVAAAGGAGNAIEVAGELEAFLVDQGAGNKGGAGVFVPLSEVKAARRQAVAHLLEQRADLPLAKTRAAEAAEAELEAAAKSSSPSQPTTTAATAAATTAFSASSTSTASAAAAPSATTSTAATPLPPYTLSVLCRNMAQVEAALKVARVGEVAVDFLEARGVAAALQAVKEAGKRAVAVSPRIIKPDEEGLWRWLLDLHPDAILVRSAGLLQQLGEEKKKRDIASQGTTPPLSSSGAVAAEDRDESASASSSLSSPSWPALHGDFSLNAANALSATELFGCFQPPPQRQGGGRGLEGGAGMALQSLTPTHDLNARQLCALQRELLAGGGGIRERTEGGGAAASPYPLEAIVHTHLPIFHTEHCVFCRFMSDGSSFRDCGHPCETHTLHLRGVDVAAQLKPPPPPASAEVGRGGESAAAAAAAALAALSSPASMSAVAEDHLVLADMGCRNTVFNSQAQSGAPYLLDLQRSGFQRFRVELVDEPSEWVAPLAEKYADLLDHAFSLAPPPPPPPSLSSRAPALGTALNNGDDGTVKKKKKLKKGEKQKMDVGFDGGGIEDDAGAEEFASRAREAMLWLQNVPDANGRAHGVSEGSLRPSEERAWASLRPTAATVAATTAAAAGKKSKVRST